MGKNKGEIPNKGSAQALDFPGHQSPGPFILHVPSFHLISSKEYWNTGIPCASADYATMFYVKRIIQSDLFYSRVVCSVVSI